MRTFLHKVMVDITGKPREYITPVWSSSIIVNAFRVYEYWFGRRPGIRFESGLYDGKLVFGTWEALFAYSETAIRHFLRKRELGFKIVKAPQLVLISGGTMPPIFSFAIAYDNSYSNASTTGVQPSIAYTCTGSNLALLVMLNSDQGSTLVSTAYNGVALTQDQTNGNQYQMWGLHLLGPATGSNNLTTTITGSFTYGYPVAIASYSGTSQTAIDTSTQTRTTGGTNITCTVNTATANCWGAIMCASTSAGLSAGTNVTLRNSERGDIIAGDSNGTITTGSYSMTINNSGGGSSSTGVMWKIAPSSGATVNSGFFFATSR